MTVYLKVIDRYHVVDFSCLLRKVIAKGEKEVRYALKKSENDYMLNEINVIPK